MKVFRDKHMEIPQTNTRCWFRNCWNRGIWRFQYLVVCEDQVFFCGLGLAVSHCITRLHTQPILSLRVRSATTATVGSS